MCGLLDLQAVVSVFLLNLEEVSPRPPGARPPFVSSRSKRYPDAAQGGGSPGAALRAHGDRERLVYNPYQASFMPVSDQFHVGPKVLLVT